MSSDDWNRTTGCIRAKASWKQAVWLHGVRLAAAGAPVHSGPDGHLARAMVVILYGVGGTLEEVRWLMSKYNLKRIKKYVRGWSLTYRHRLDLLRNNLEKPGERISVKRSNVRGVMDALEGSIS